VGEEDIFFTVYDDDTMDTREEQREKTECRTPQEIANIVANLISPAVQRHLTPKPD
jgi:hypothetical protein